MQNRRVGGGIESLEQRRLLNFAPFGIETTVPAFGRVLDSSVAVAGNGSYLVATAARDEAVNTVSIVRYAADGTRISNATELFSNASTGGETQVSASVDNDGDAVVAYRTLENGNIWNVYFSRISRSGVVSAPVLLDTAASPSPSSGVELSDPAVAMGTDGRFFVGWLAGLNRSDHEARMRAFSASGAPRAAEFVASSDSVPFTSPSDLDLDVPPDGNSAAFAYVVSGTDLNISNVRFGRVSTTGLIGEIHFTQGEDLPGPRNTGQPSIASHSDNSYVLSYGEVRGTDNDPNPDAAAYVERYGAASVLQGNPIKLGSTIGGTDIFSAIESQADGGFVVAFTSAGPAGSVTLYAQRFNTSGQSDEAGPVDIDSAPDAEDRPLRHFSIGADVYGTTLVGYIESEDTIPAISESHYRRLTSEAAIVEKSILYVLGTRRSENISIKASRSGSVIVTRDSIVKKFDGPPVVQSVAVDAFNGNDTIFNDTALFMTVRGGSGNDSIFGGFAADVLRGNTGDDLINGRNGVDRLIGDDGNDSLNGNENNDRIEGGAGDDVLRGQSGRDRIFGGAGHDRILGGTQDDSLFGEAGSDRIFGEDGNDLVDGGSDGDRLEGNAGDDLLQSRDGFIDGLFGGDGLDTSDNDANDVLDSVEVTA